MAAKLQIVRNYIGSCMRRYLRRRLSSRPPLLRPPQLLKGLQVLDTQLDRPATRERPLDVARHAAPKAPAAIVDLNQRALAFKAVADAFRYVRMVAVT